MDELESQMRGEVATRDAAAPQAPTRRRSTPATDEDEGEGKNVALPEVDTLVARLPEEVRDTLEDLFRARFVAVKKLPKKAFQPASTRGSGGTTPSETQPKGPRHESV